MASRHIMVQDFFSSRLKNILILCSLVLLLLSYFFIIRKPELAFYPDKSICVDYHDDSFDSGNSRILTKIQTNNVVGIECILREGFMFPYSGIDLNICNKGEVIDVSNFNKVRIKVTASNLEHVWVHLCVEDKNVKDKLNRMSDRRLLADINVSTGQEKMQVLEIDIRKFVTPDWWYTIVKQPKIDFSDPELDKLIGMTFATGLNPKLNQTCGFKIHSIQFYKDNTFDLIILFIIEIIFISCLHLLFYFKKLQSKKNVVELQYTPLKDTKKPSISIDFLAYIDKNYSDPDLNLTSIAKATGKSERAISDFILEKFNVNIRTYINSIRIAEAKRLLEESKMNSSEIAYKVGFNSPANFNRVFKSFTNQSPTDFLQKTEK
jgi:AraC-like DNA-binding protein